MEVTEEVKGKWENELEILKGMGFDTQLGQSLLLERNGDLQSVVDTFVNLNK